MSSGRRWLRPRAVHDGGDSDADLNPAGTCAPGDAEAGNISKTGIRGALSLQTCLDANAAEGLRRLRVRTSSWRSCSTATSRILSSANELTPACTNATRRLVTSSAPSLSIT